MAWQRATLADVMGQRVIYRNLAPVDPALIGLDGLWQRIGLERYQIPRKTSVEYARAVWMIMQQAQQLRGENSPLERVLLIGDSQHRFPLPLSLSDPGEDLRDDVVAEGDLRRELVHGAGG